MSVVEASEILRYLPHGYPLLMLDRVTELDAGVRGLGIKSITANEICINGHFPGNPILPGALIIECMAQTAGVVFGYRQGPQADDSEAKHSARLAMIQNMKFRKEVIPGDQLVVEVKLIKRFGRTIKISTEARVGDDVIASGTMTLAG